MTLVRWKPAHSMFDFDRELDSIFEDFLKPVNVTSQSSYGFSPVTDVNEDENNYRISMELPGLSKNDVKIEVKDNVMTISGEKKAEKDEKEDNYRYFERRFGKFERSFRLRNDILADKIDARFKDGVLTIDIPKAEIAKPKTIAVK